MNQFYQSETMFATSGGSTIKKEETPKKPVWTKEDSMACKIQTYYRGFR